MINTSACPGCGGAGRAVTDPCRKCGGAGKVEGTKTVRITIPAGVDTGQKLRLSNEGLPGESGAPPGDLYVIMNLLPHTFFQRDGQDVVCEVPISFVQAALGAEFEVPTLYGPEKLRIPPGTQTATVFRLREKGFPHLRGYHKGDQHVFVRVQVPSKLNAKQKSMLEEFAKLSGEETSAPQAGLFAKLKDLFMN
jgi:molecular chaperone DnaJ